MLSKNTKIIVLFGIVFFVMSIVAFVVFFTLTENHKVHLYEKRVSHAQLKHDMDSIAKISSVLEKTESEREIVFSRILKEDDVVSFLTLVETIGKEQGITLLTNSLKVSPNNERFETLALDIVVKGPYEALMHTLAIFEQLPYQIAIHNVQINKEQNEGVGVWESTYTIYVTKYKKYEI